MAGAQVAWRSGGSFRYLSRQKTYPRVLFRLRSGPVILESRNQPPNPRSTAMPRFILFLIFAIVSCSQLLAQQPASRTGPFTQPPRSVRSRAIDQQHVRLDLKFDWEKQEMKGKASHTLSLLAP